MSTMLESSDTVTMAREGLVCCDKLKINYSKQLVRVSGGITNCALFAGVGAATGAISSTWFILLSCLNIASLYPYNYNIMCKILRHFLINIFVI